MERRKEHLHIREIRRRELSITAEAEFIITRAMAEDARIVSMPPLVFLSTATGDA